MKDKVKKILAWIVSFLFSGIGVQFIPKIRLSSIDVNDRINYLLTPRFSILDVVLILIVAVVLYLILYFLFIRHHKTKQERMKDELRQFNRMVFDDGAIIAEWNPIIGFSGKKGIAGDFQLYCNHHDPPQRMNMGACPIDGCKYHDGRINEYKVKELVESALDQEIRKLKKKYKLDKR